MFCADGRFFAYWKHSFLKRRHQIISNQPTIIPEGMVTMIQITNLKRPPFLSQVLHLTTISTTQFTPGMRRRIICTRRGSLLNQVIFPLLIKYLCFYYITPHGYVNRIICKKLYLLAAGRPQITGIWRRFCAFCAHFSTLLRAKRKKKLFKIALKICIGALLVIKMGI